MSKSVNRDACPRANAPQQVHERDNPTIYPTAFWGRGAEILRVVADWNDTREAQGQLFCYTELCPITLGAVIRAATGQTMSAFGQEHLWRPLGAEADATWCTDSMGCEYNCVNFAARPDEGRAFILRCHSPRCHHTWGVPYEGEQGAA